jgi:hypothetical protein
MCMLTHQTPEPVFNAGFLDTLFSTVFEHSGFAYTSKDCLLIWVFILRAYILVENMRAPNRDAVTNQTGENI